MVTCKEEQKQSIPEMNTESRIKRYELHIYFLAESKYTLLGIQVTLKSFLLLNLHN
jgi:hypothetical protein